MVLKPAHWITLLALSLLWGSSYLMIAMALAVWQPAQLAALRILLAAIFLWLVIAVRRPALPGQARSWQYLVFIALVGNCLPFFLISWGQQQLESGLAGILAASSPLMVLVLAHFALHDEKLGPRHVVAFIAGFAGILILMGPESIAAIEGSGERFWAQIAILAASGCYAVATVATRRMPPVAPVVAAGCVMLLASGMMAPFLGGAARRLPEISASAAAAIGFLGIFATGFASIMYFNLVKQTGARFTSLLNYLVPVWAVVLGAKILGEEWDITWGFSLILILGGLILTAKSE